MRARVRLSVGSNFAVEEANPHPHCSPSLLTLTAHPHLDTLTAHLDRSLLTSTRTRTLTSTLTRTLTLTLTPQHRER